MPRKTRPRPMNALQTGGNALLSKQLASISATLADASKRRDTASKEMASGGTSRSPPMPSAWPSPTQHLVDRPPSSPLRGSSAVVNDAYSGHDGLATASGAQAAPETVNGVAEHQKYGPLSSIPMPRLSGKDLGYGHGDVTSLMRELEEMSVSSMSPVEPSGGAEIEDLGSLRNRLEKMLTPSPKQKTATSALAKMQLATPFTMDPTLERIKNDQKRVITIPQKALCYATALQLEKTGIKWGLVQGWTRYLFSAGSSGHTAVREKSQLVEAANAELDALIKEVVDDDGAYLASQKKNILPCRLFLSNIAAGAGAEEVALYLSEFRHDIKKIKMLARDPISRTQTALIDMYTKGEAEKASYIMGSIFGLVVKISLATEGD